MSFEVGDRVELVDNRDGKETTLSRLIQWVHPTTITGTVLEVDFIAKKLFRCIVELDTPITRDDGSVSYRLACYKRNLKLIDAKNQLKLEVVV